MIVLNRGFKFRFCILRFSVVLINGTVCRERKSDVKEGVGGLQRE